MMFDRAPAGGHGWQFFRPVMVDGVIDLRDVELRDRPG